MPRPKRIPLDPHQRVIAAQEAIKAALRKHRKKWFAIDGVVGFGVGGVYPHLTALFALDMTASPARRRKARARLPRWILVRKKRVPSEFMELGHAQPLLATIGDPTPNRRSMHVDGGGAWQMGARIQVFDKGGATTNLGTAGCVVRYTDPKASKEEMVLTAGHVVVAPGNDVAQWEQNRTKVPAPQVPTKKDLHNWVGLSGEVTTTPIDGGLIKECQGEDKTIIDIGAPKLPQEAEAWSHVRKSGGATGYTYGQIIAPMTEIKLVAPGVGDWIDAFLVVNVCTQRPANPKVLKEDPTKTTMPDTPPDLFASESDSGALVVLGLPEIDDVFGGEGLKAKLLQQKGKERQATIDKFYGAAVGLVVGKAPMKLTINGVAVDQDCVVVQRLQTILDALKVEMVI